MGRAYRQQGRAKEAIKQLERAVELRPSYVEAYMQLSQAAADTKNLERAGILLNKALKLAQRDALAARVLIQRGDLFRSQGKYGSAIDDFNRAISLDPRNLAAYVGLGETYRAKGEPDQAIDRYRAAILLDETYVDAHVKLGNAYREAGRFDEAVASYQRANELQPQTGWLLLLVGDTLMDAGKTDEALAAYREALTAQPDYEQDSAYAARIATVYQAQGKLDDALAAAEQAEKLAAAAEESIEGPLQLQADILSDQERWQAAIDLYTQVLELNPERAQSIRGLALAYEAQGRNRRPSPNGEPICSKRRRANTPTRPANTCAACAGRVVTQMTQIIFLGVGGAMVHAPADNHTAFLIRAHSSTVLLDSGPSIMRQLELAGVGVEELTHIYISHQHGDHSLGLPMVLLNRVLFWPELPLTVMAAPEVLDAAHGIVSLAYPDLMQRMDLIIGFTPLDTNPSPSPLPFDATVTYRLAPGRHTVPTWAIRLDFSSGKSLVVSADTGLAEPIARLATGATLLVHDTFDLTPSAGGSHIHSSAGQVGELANQAGVHTLALVHRQDTSEQTAFSYRTLAAKHFGGEILVPQAGDTVTL